MTTAASGGNREELLGQRPAGHERQRNDRWEPQPDSHWQAGQAELDAEALMGHEMPGLATEDSRHWTEAAEHYSSRNRKLNSGRKSFADTPVARPLGELTLRSND